MSILARCAAVLTVLLSFGLMAVSVYAAKTETQHAVIKPASQESPVADDAGPQSSALPDDQDFAFVPRSLTPVIVEPVYPPTPTVTLRYAAPEGSSSSAPSGHGRNNLSPGARTWPVLSIKPGTVDPLLLSRRGIDIPPDQLGWMLQIAQETNVPWQVYGAIAKVESDLGQNMATSSAGAIGYGQFLPSTWEIYGEGGDPYSFHDVIPAMGRFLLDSGAPEDIPAALYAYNHSWPYVAQVLSYAASYGYAGVADTQQGLREGLIWPVVGPISSYFGAAHPLGIDLDQTMALGTAIVAAHSGVVLFAGGDPCCSYGRYVILASASGMTTLYAHFELLSVETGQSVRQGEPLGIVGNTGYSTGTHLHFEVIDAGVRRDPLLYLP